MKQVKLKKVPYNVGQKDYYDAQRKIKKIIYIAILPLFIINLLWAINTSFYNASIVCYLSFLIFGYFTLNKSQKYRMTKSHTYIYRYQGELGAIDGKRNLIITALIGTGLSFAIVLAGMLLFASIMPFFILKMLVVTAFQIIGLKVAIKYLTLQINAKELYTDEERAEISRRIRSDPRNTGGTLSLTDVRNVAGTTNPSSPNYN